MGETEAWGAIMPDGSRKFAHDGILTFIPMARRLCACGHPIDAHNFTSCSHADYGPDATRAGKVVVRSRCACPLDADRAFAALNARYDRARRSIESL